MKNPETFEKFIGKKHFAIFNRLSPEKQRIVIDAARKMIEQLATDDNSDLAAAESDLDAIREKAIAEIRDTDEIKEKGEF